MGHFIQAILISKFVLFFPSLELNVPYNFPQVVQ